MAKSFFYRYFGFGKMPENYRSQLQSEGIISLDEGLKGSVTYINFHRPGKYSGWERRGLIASIALTKTRILALNSAIPLINVPLTDERLHQMKYSLENPETLCVTFDAGLFQPKHSGTIEYRFHTLQAESFLKELIANHVLSFL